MNTGVGILSLLQGIFLIQELNQGLLHYRWILYHLSYQGSLPVNAIRENFSYLEMDSSGGVHLPLWISVSS